MRLAGLIATLLLSAAPAGAAPSGQGLALAPCQLGPARSAARLAARCGTLRVPEDHANPGGRQLELFVAVVPADDPGGPPDPLFLLAGGPGQAATAAYPAVHAAFARVGRSRDLVLVDQRGTGRSSPLSCPALDDPGTLDRSDAEEAAAVEACAAALAPRADLRRYGTEAFARDLDLVRAALGYQRINLFGASYGTRAALVYARAFPDRVRSMVLDGVAPFGMAVGDGFSDDVQRALDLLLSRCEADPACRARFPALGRDLASLAASLDRAPATVRLREPVSGRPRSLEVRGDTLRALVFKLLYTPEGASLAPLLLRQALAGDLGPLVAAGLPGTGDAPEIWRALQLSVLCAEDVPFYAAPPEGRARLFLQDLVRGAFARGCARWPHEVAPPAARQAPRLEIPALLLSGEGDPVTPPRWAEQALAGLPRGRHLTVPGAAHGTFYRGCVPRLLAAFVAAGDAASLDAACLARIRPLPFFLEPGGPSP